MYTSLEEQNITDFYCSVLIPNTEMETKKNDGFANRYSKIVSLLLIFRTEAQKITGDL